MAVEYNDEALQKFIGSGMAIADTVNTPFFMDDMIDYSYGMATNLFNREVVAYAVATKKINHMFEWGAAGINPTPGAASLSPFTSVARLWRHTIKGTQANKVIGFAFKPSKVPVPLPTPKTDVDLQEWKDNMPRSRHIFHWKSEITELGVPVTIKPRNAEAMFIPLGPRPKTTDPDALRRGFTFAVKPMVVVPGKEAAGNFSVYWSNWWAGVGLPHIAELMDAAYKGDILEQAQTWRRYKSRKRRKTYGFTAAYMASKEELTARSRARAEAARKALADERQP